MTEFPLTWVERRILFRIEEEQENPSHSGWGPQLGDLAYMIGLHPKTCRELVSGLVAKGYLEARVERGSRLQGGKRTRQVVRFTLLKPLGGQYRPIFNPETAEIEFARQF